MFKRHENSPYFLFALRLRVFARDSSNQKLSQRRKAKTEELGFQREGLWPQCHDRVIARRMASHMVDDSLRRQAVNRRLDFVEAADAAQVVPIGRQRACAGR